MITIRIRVEDCNTDKLIQEIFSYGLSTCHEELYVHVQCTCTYELFDVGTVIPRFSLRMHHVYTTLRQLEK